MALRSFLTASARLLVRTPAAPSFQKLAPALACRSVSLLGCRRAPVFAPRFVRCFATEGPKDAVKITSACARRIAELGKKSKDPVLLRVSIEGGGCGGFKYGFKMCKEADLEKHDLLFSHEGSRVVIDDISMELMKGATIDFTEDMMAANFVVANNPQAESHCGCGSSFTSKSV